ncbi:MAG: NERD domain-containing protein [Chloroflexi bacterium]|nr:NERD domain-containing protein [Chloroflexota bacterium]
MRIETNQKLIDRNKAWSGRMFFVTLGVIIASFFLLNSPFFTSQAQEGTGLLISLVLPALLLPVAFLSTLFSIRLTNLWVRQPRPEKLLADNLKGISKSLVLYNYYHFPARHVVIAPGGVIAIVTRWQEGKYVVKGDKWSAKRSAVGRLLSAMRMDGIANPSLDAQMAAEHVDKILADINPDVPVFGVVLFNDPRVEFSATESTIPIMYIQAGRFPNLREWIKGLPKAAAQLTPEQIQRFEEKTLPRK